MNTPVLAVMLTAVTVPLTPRPVNVPTDVIFGCAAVVTVPAVVAFPDILPTMLPEIITEVLFALIVCTPI